MPQQVQENLIKAERENASSGRTAGIFVIVLGALLMVAGIAGAVDLTLEGLGMKAKAAKAAPGIVLMLVGLFIIWRSNLKVTVAQKK